MSQLTGNGTGTFAAVEGRAARSVPAELRYRPLGVFRFVLAMMVLVQHGLLLLPPGSREYLYSAELGIVAVAVFFAISGFIVAEANQVFYAGRPAAFLANRVLRLVPPYLAALALAVAVHAGLHLAGTLATLDQPLAGSPLQPAVLLSGVLDIVPGFQPRSVSHQDFEFIPFAWTLRVEFAFYIVAFLAYLSLGRFAAGSWARKILTSAILASCTGVVLWSIAGHGSGPQQLLYVPFFALGVGVYLAWRSPSWFRVGGAAICCVGAALAFADWRQRGHPVLAIQLPLLAALLAIFVLLAVHAGIPRSWARWDKRLGELSYPIYINHGTVIVALASVSAKPGMQVYLLCMPISILLALVMNRLVETPMRSLRDALRGAKL